MYQRRPVVLTFVKSPPSKPVSSVTKLPSNKCAMARAGLRSSPQFLSKAAHLHAVAPDMAAFVEELIDDLLAEVS